MLFKTGKDNQPLKKILSGFRLGNKGLATQQIILIAVVVIALAAAFLVTKIVLKPMFSKGQAEKVAENKDEANSDKKEKDKEKENKKKDEGHKKEKKDSHGGGHGGNSGEEEVASNIYQVDGIIVNPAATGGSRFLTTNIGFEMANEESHEIFKSQEIKIRDALISILSSKTVTELSDLQSREKVRLQILNTVNHLCQPAQAEAIYFVDYVLQ